MVKRLETGSFPQSRIFRSSRLDMNKTDRIRARIKALDPEPTIEELKRENSMLRSQNELLIGLLKIEIKARQKYQGLYKGFKGAWKKSTSP